MDPRGTEQRLGPGAELGPYVIEAGLGAGGMGQVYRAKDKRLRRTVALKVLSLELCRTADMQQRLEREAQLISSLNHPHICTLHDIGRQGEVDYLVMEFLEGETLAERLKRGALPLRELLEVSIQIADALEAAHIKGIIHRDIKPANIFVTGKAQIKVLDFGLAKLRQSASGTEFETVATQSGLTTPGVVMGTVPYMSPEQARGEEMDARTDLFSFGVMLYEMATGARPFQGSSATEILAAILRTTPVAPRQRRPNLPFALETIINAALEKDRELRYQAAGEMRAALMRLRRDAESPTAIAEASAPPSSLMTRRTAIAALGGAAVGAAAAVWGIRPWRGTMPRALMRFSVAVPEGELLRSTWGNRLAIAPDGSRFGFIATREISAATHYYLRSLGDLESKLVKDLAVGSAFFSPDGHWLGYFTPTPPALRRMPLAGGAPVTIWPRDAATGNAGATWAEGDTIYFVSDLPGGVMSVPAAGGQPKEVLSIDIAQGERALKYPFALPRGRGLLFTVAMAYSESFDDAHVAALSLRTGQKKVLVEGGTHPRYSPSGHLVYARSGNLLAVRFDPDRLEVSGQPVTVLEGVLMSRNTGVANFDLSPSGDLVYVPGVCEGGARTLYWVDRSGHAEKLPLPPRSYLHPRISPDAHKLAIEIEGSNHDCYIYDFASGVLSNITADGVSHWPLWSPDGKTIGYRSGVMGHFRLWQVPADRSRPPEQVSAAGFSQSAESYSPDGRALAYTAADPGAPSKIIVVPLQGDQKPRPLDESKYAEGSPKFSPDGRWVAYCSSESGKPQVYVEAFPGPGSKTQVSNDGGTDPVWRRSGSELFYRDGDSMMAVPVSTTSGFSVGRPHELWKDHYSHGMSSSCGPPGFSSSNYDVSADGTRFLMIKDDDQDRATSKEIVVVLDWADEVRRLEQSRTGRA